jgi:hypothetical protein
MIIRPNLVRGISPGYAKTVVSAKARWPEVKIVEG